MIEQKRIVTYLLSVHLSVHALLLKETGPEDNSRQSCQQGMPAVFCSPVNVTKGVTDT